jgi:hypothetical protein
VERGVAWLLLSFRLPLCDVVCVHVELEASCRERERETESVCVCVWGGGVLEWAGDNTPRVGLDGEGTYTGLSEIHPVALMWLLGLTSSSAESAEPTMTARTAVSFGL